MTNIEACERIRELSAIIESRNCTDEEWNAAFNERDELLDFLDTYGIRAFYEEHIKGKTWGEIDPDDWDFYSDWHKDVYGFRPKSI